MAKVGNTIECRMLCASGSAYGIDTTERYTPTFPFADGVGWDAQHPPVPICGGELDINACLVGKNQDGIIAAFRGTIPPSATNDSSLLDWWQDIVDSTPETRNNLPGKVHIGFWDAVNSIWPKLREQVSQFHQWFPDQRFYVTGHSKGGPMASIAAARFHFDELSLPPPAAVYTFASPHPGNSDFAKGFPLKTIPVTRFENYLDLVPLLPPTMEFVHLAAKIPLIGRLFAKAKGWHYAPLGKLQYVTEAHEIIGNKPFLNTIRLGEFIVNLMMGEPGLKKIADAHSLDCGFGYISGVCPTGVCPELAS